MTNRPAQAPTSSIPPAAYRLVGLVPAGGKIRHHGLTTAEAAARAWAIGNGFRVVKVRTDPAGALDDVSAGRVAGVVVAGLETLGDVAAQEAYFSAVRRAGGAMFSTLEAEGDQLGANPDPARAMVRAALVAAEALQAGMVRARLVAGLDRKRAAGGYVGGRPAHGFRAQAGRLVVDAREQATIARAVELRTAGATYREIADVLAAEGRRARDDSTTWHPETVRRMCRRTFVEGADGVPGPWNGYDGGQPDRTWANDPDRSGPQGALTYE